MANTGCPGGLMWKSPRPSTMKRTSSSSCQCSRENLASIVSRPGVSARTSITSDAGQPRDVLVVVDDWNPFGMIVAPHPLEPLQHLEARQSQAAFRSVVLRQHRAPDRMSMEHGCGATGSGNRDV